MNGQSFLTHVLVAVEPLPLVCLHWMVGSLVLCVPYDVAPSAGMPAPGLSDPHQVAKKPMRPAYRQALPAYCRSAARLLVRLVPRGMLLLDAEHCVVVKKAQCFRFVSPVAKATTYELMVAPVM